MCDIVKNMSHLADLYATYKHLQTAFLWPLGREIWNIPGNCFQFI